MFEREDSFGERADALWAGADLGEDAQGLEGGEAAFTGPRMLLTIRLWARWSSVRRRPLCGVVTVAPAPGSPCR